MRKLATAAIAFSVAVFAANYILPMAWLPVCSVILAIAGAVLAQLHRKWLRGLILSLLAAALGLGCFALHAQRTTASARALDGEQRQISARLLVYPQVYEGYCRAEVRLTGEELPHLNAIVYDSGKWLAQAEPGQLLRFTGRLSAADTRYGEAYDGYTSRDIYLTIQAQSAILVLDAGADLRTAPVRMQHAIGQMALRLFPDDVSAFLKALMLGDKTELYTDAPLQLSLSRAGFMHVVAVSGMHVAYLVELLQLLFGKNRRSSLLCIGLVWLFVLVTGASPSALRAGIMQSFLLLAPVFRRENDPVTSLSAALALILLFNPYAAASVSLQLSFAAMAGLMCFSYPIRRGIRALLPEGKLGALLERPADIAAASLSSMVFTLPLVAVHFGYAAILSPLSAMLALWVVPICFGGAYLACALAALVPALGAAAAWLIAWPARYLLLVSRLVSAIPFAVVYMQNSLALLWLLFCYASFAVAALSTLDKRLKLLLPAALSGLLLFTVTGVTRASYERRPGVISVLDVGQGQCIAIFSGKSTVMIDCGGLYTLKDAGETAGAYLRSCGRKQLDLLLLTHLDNDHINGLPMLLEMTKVKRILMPVSEAGQEQKIVQLQSLAAAHGTELIFLQNDLETAVGEIALSLFAPAKEGSGNDHGLMAALSLGSYDMLVTGDASARVEERLLADYELRGMELLIVGHHGSRSSSSETLLRSIGADTAVISVGYNSYGHPDEEILERLAACGYNVYRTDLDGNVVIRIGQEYGETK